jgi:hypothetical protein
MGISSIRASDCNGAFNPHHSPVTPSVHEALERVVGKLYSDRLPCGHVQERGLGVIRKGCLLARISRPIRQQSVLCSLRMRPVIGVNIARR